MRPSARQLIEGIDWSLQNRVAPVTEDKWAASTLRSTHCLLQHLAVRVDQEGQLLHEDNADLRTVLGAVAARLTGAPWARERSAVEAALARAWREAGAYPTVASMSDENESMRGVVDDLVSVLHGAAPDQRAVADGALGDVDAYLARRREREQPLFMPAFMASNF
jgi:hypothetical protein